MWWKTLILMGIWWNTFICKSEEMHIWTWNSSFCLEILWCGYIDAIINMIFMSDMKISIVNWGDDMNFQMKRRCYRTTPHYKAKSFTSIFRILLLWHYTLQHAATHCTPGSTNLECGCYKEYHVHCSRLQHTCNTPATHWQHTATHCNSIAHWSLECCCYEE